MQNFYKLSSAAQTAAYQLSEFSNYVSEAAKMADSVRMVSNQSASTRFCVRKQQQSQ